MAELVSQRKFAEMRGVSHTAVRKAIRDGRITTDPSGKIDPELASRQWDDNTNQAKKREPLDGDERKGPDVPAGNKKPPTAAGAYAVARAIREEYGARMARLEYESKAGSLLPADKVKLEAFNAARLVRDNLLNIPDKISNELAAETDPDKIHARLTEVIHGVLEELAAEGRRRAGLEEP